MQIYVRSWPGLANISSLKTLCIFLRTSVSLRQNARLEGREMLLFHRQRNAAVSLPAISSCVLKTSDFSVVSYSVFMGCFLLSDLKPPAENVDPIER